MSRASSVAPAVVRLYRRSVAGFCVCTVPIYPEPHVNLGGYVLPVYLLYTTCGWNATTDRSYWLSQANLTDEWNGCRTYQQCQALYVGFIESTYIPSTAPCGHDLLPNARPPPHARPMNVSRKLSCPTGFCAVVGS